MARFHFTTEEVAILRSGIDEVQRAAKKATKALDALGLVDMRVAGYETLGEVVSSKLKDSLGDADACDVELGHEETMTARLGCTLLLAAYSKLAQSEVDLFVDTSATHDRANDVKRVRDVLDGQGIVVEEPKKTRARRAASDDAPSTGLSLVTFAGGDSVEAEAVEVASLGDRATPALPRGGDADADATEDEIPFVPADYEIVDDAGADIAPDGGVDPDDFDAPDPSRHTSDMLAALDADRAKLEALGADAGPTADDFPAPIPDETLDALAEQEIAKIRAEDEAAPMVIPRRVVRDASPNDDAPEKKAGRGLLKHGTKTTAKTKAAPNKSARKFTPAPKPEKAAARGARKGVSRDA